MPRYTLHRYAFMSYSGITKYNQTTQTTTEAMNNILKADLFSANPVEIEGELKMEINFSEAARWAPKELLKIVVPVSEWLQFLEDCFIQLERPAHVFTPGNLSITCQSSQVLLIGSNRCSFSIPKTKWKRLIEIQAERLLLSGAINFS